MASSFSPFLCNLHLGGGAAVEDDDAITEVNVGNFAQTIAEATETRSGTKFYFFLKKIYIAVSDATILLCIFFQMKYVNLDVGFFN